jgi:hypothetical protein
MNPLEALQHIAKMSVEGDLYYSKVYKYKSGLFNPLLQTIQGISFEDGSIVNDIKIYSVCGFKYTLIPPGTEILVGFVNADPGLPYLVGVDPRAMTVVGLSGQLSGILTMAPTPTPGTPILDGMPVFINTIPGV